MAPPLNCYAMTRWTRTESGRPAASIRFSTATPTAASGLLGSEPTGPQTRSDQRLVASHGRFH